MKHKIIMLMLLISSMAFGAREGVVVDSDGNLKRPTKSVFVEKNHIVSNEVVCLRVDMLGGTWSDAEMKILNSSGELLLFATTNYRDKTHYHDNDGTWDSNCKIFYYIAGTKYAYRGQCSSPKQRHLVDANNASSIGAKEDAQVTAVEFYPNLSGFLNGKSIREIVLDPNNSIIISRKNANGYEKDANGNRIWCPVIPQYYKAFPQEK